MRSRIKHLIAGLGILGVLLWAVAAVPVASEPGPAAQAPMQQPDRGRYTIIFNPNVRADTYLLDTETGKVWRPVQYTDVAGEPTVWQFMDRLDDREAFREWVSEQQGP